MARLLLKVESSKERAMKLTSALVERTLGQFEAQSLQAQAVPENHPAITQLTRVFGDHTFFLDNDGLSIVEPTESARENMRTAQVVKLAHWQDPTRTSLAPHEPQPTDVVVTLESNGSDTDH
jgi:hypothetical protein